MDWQAVAINLILSAIIAILLIIANWTVNVWDQHSNWGRWKQVFLRYSSVSSVYTKVQGNKIQILEKLTIFTGILVLVPSIFILFEVLYVSVFASWLNINLKEVYSLLFFIFSIFEIFSTSLILTKAFLRGNPKKICMGLRYITFAVYLSAEGIIISVFNLQSHSLSLSALFGILIIQALIVGVVAITSKYLELSLFGVLWNEMINTENPIMFPYITLALKSGHLISGQLIDFMNKATLVLKHGGEYLHVPWNEIEFIKVLKQS